MSRPWLRTTRSCLRGPSRGSEDVFGRRWPFPLLALLRREPISREAPRAFPRRGSAFRCSSLRRLVRLGPARAPAGQIAWPGQSKPCRRGPSSRATPRRRGAASVLAPIGEGSRGSGWPCVAADADAARHAIYAPRTPWNNNLIARVMAAWPMAWPPLPSRTRTASLTCGIHDAASRRSMGGSSGRRAARRALPGRTATKPRSDSVKRKMIGYPDARVFRGPRRSGPSGRVLGESTPSASGSESRVRDSPGPTRPPGHHDPHEWVL